MNEHTVSLGLTVAVAAYALAEVAFYFARKWLAKVRK